MLEKINELTDGDPYASSQPKDLPNQNSSQQGIKPFAKRKPH